MMFLNEGPVFAGSFSRPYKIGRGLVIRLAARLAVISIKCLLFLAPIGAQETLMFVCMYDSNLSRAVNLHHSGSNLQAISQE